ncbi:MAG: NAD(P)-dependent oxidoreductase [Verrucomicrobiales bacterium]|nr:NAD(P)-dependent oxidoreductase [Verrucomicrobiales bacterium]
MSERVLITGATGCIGSATVTWLRENGFDDIVAFTRSGKSESTEAIAGDISDRSAVEKAVSTVRPSRIIHLAAFQSPDCQANPFRGLEINVHGTHFLLEAAAKLGSGHLKRFVFASSAAVYGPRSLYPGKTVTEDCGLQPPNLYGYWKVAGEGAAQAFHLESDVPTLSLRLATTYGPGRDLGLTSAPTTALKHAARGEDFAMPYVGREHYHFVDDVGAAFAISAVEEFSGGCEAYNLRGQSMETTEFLSEIQSVAREMGLPESKLSTAPDAFEALFVCDLDQTRISASFPEMPETAIREGIRKSLQHFQKSR